MKINVKIQVTERIGVYSIFSYFKLKLMKQIKQMDLTIVLVKLQINNIPLTNGRSRIFSKLWIPTGRITRTIYNNIENNCDNL